jgi:hypothetical protein
MRVRVGVSVLAMVCALAAPAAAQEPAPAAGSGPSLHGRVFGWGDFQQMSARDSFEAVSGESIVSGLGGGLEVHRLWRGVFLRGSISRQSVAAERVFVFDGSVFALGIPLDVTMTPIELGAGWRFGPLGGRVVPYIGAGALWLGYREDGAGTSSSEDVSETYSGATIFGGIDVSVWRFVSAGAEVAWRTAQVKDAGGVFEAFGENNLGGISFRLMLSVGK